MSDNTELNAIIEELQNPQTTSERVQEIFDDLYSKDVFINIKEVTVGVNFYIVSLRTRNSFLDFFNTGKALYFPKEKLTQAQIDKLMEAADKAKHKNHNLP